MGKERKEIGIEKLIELLNEYSKKKHNIAMRELNGEYGQGFHYLNYGSSYSELLMVSKKYEFIKWLVENDKIDTVLFANELNKVVYLADFNFRNDMGFYKIIYYQLLMLLSISDTPIEDLISYLK